MPEKVPPRAAQTADIYENRYQGSGGFSGTASATTDANGQCTFTTGAINKSSPSVTLTITDSAKPGSPDPFTSVAYSCAPPLMRARTCA